MTSLDAIANNPELAASLPRLVVRRLIYRAIAVQQACYAALIDEPVDQAPVENDDVLDLATAARILGIAAKTLANGANSTYKGIRVHSMSRRLAFSRRAIEMLQRERGLMPAGSVLTVAPGAGCGTHGKGRRDRRQ